MLQFYYLLNAFTNLAVQVSPFQHQLPSSVRKPLGLDYWPGSQKCFKSLPSTAIKKETENLREDNLQVTSEAADTAAACLRQRELVPHHGYQKGSFSLNLPLIN